ncbi:MAG: nitroreductase family protein [Fretibacterium sp.]|nr:nitroreductase family protein [Fretibacterium sp.]
MDFEEILTHRVSTRKYNDRMPDEQTLQKIIDAALLSPIVRWHKMHLSIVTNQDAMNLAEEATDEFFKGQRHRPHLYGAPVWIILSGKKYEEDDPDSTRLKNENLFWNVGSIIENMELQATALGLASCGINTAVVSMLGRPDVKKAVGIPDGYEALASVIIGYSDEPCPEREVKPDLIPVSYIK